MFDMQLFQLNHQTISILRAANEMDSTVLITGSTGTGKSHLAHAIHQSSPKRSSGRWSKVNLATLSENLIESELFGHERGAFTGADSRRLGKLEACNGGTVFLDEIGELPLRLQAKLLDFIQYKRISPVGSNREIELDVRIIVATNKILESCVKSGEFRSDLFHRLNVFHVRIPDIALNPEAVMHFARTFLSERSNSSGKKIKLFSKETEQLFRLYPWPGNIRELENLIEFAVAMEQSDTVQISPLPSHFQEFARDHMSQHSTSTESTDSVDSTPKADMASIQIAAQSNAVGFLEFPITLDFHECKSVFEKTYLEQALRLCRGQINLTSRRIGLNKVSLTEKIKRYGIDWRKIRFECLGPSLKDGNKVNDAA